MKTITISDKAAEMIEDIRRDNDDHKKYMCEAMQTVINLIVQNCPGLTIDTETICPLIYLSDYQELRNELFKEED